MDTAIRAIIILLVFVALGVFAIAYFKSFMGKAQRGTLSVPLGRNAIGVMVCDDSRLKPYKFAQTFDVVVMPGEHALVNRFTEKRQSGEGAISFKGSIMGFADPSSSQVMALTKLAGSYQKVVVQAVVLSVDKDGTPVMQLKLPDTAWFKRALSEAQKQGGKRRR